jgi:dTDP-4-amino-4,6-dideoxygalactose transaminase
MKRIVSDLAILGGPKLFVETLHVGRPNIGKRDKFHKYVDDIFDRKWLTNHGPLENEFETRLSDYLGVKNCIVTNNGTIGLELAIRALGLSGEVIVPSFTFVATPHALKWQEVRPVFCDIDPNTHNLDPYKVRQSITPRTTGILGVHIWGRGCAIEELTGLAQEYNLKLLFDAAHAFGCTHNETMIGQFGDAEVFSFHATKYFNTFEGGAITTNDDELAERIRLMHNFGFTGLDSVEYIGTNGKMSEISAAMGLVGMESIEDFKSINYHNFLTYMNGMANLPGIKMIKYDTNEKNNYQYIVMEIDSEKCGINRDRLMNILQAENVRARRYFFPGCHRMEPYKTLMPTDGERLPETEALVEKSLILPTGTSMDDEKIHQVIELIKFVVSHSYDINQMLDSSSHAA